MRRPEVESLTPKSTVPTRPMLTWLKRRPGPDCCAAIYFRGAVGLSSHSRRPRPDTRFPNAKHPRRPHEEAHARGRHRRRRPDRLQPAVPDRERRDARQGPAGHPAAARDPGREGAEGPQGRDDGARRLRVPAARGHDARPPTRRSRSRMPTWRCSWAPARAARAWSARTSSRPTAPSSRCRAAPWTRGPPATSRCWWWATPPTPTPTSR